MNVLLLHRLTLLFNNASLNPSTGGFTSSRRLSTGMRSVRSGATMHHFNAVPSNTTFALLHPHHPSLVTSSIRFATSVAEVKPITNIKPSSYQSRGQNVPLSVDSKHHRESVQVNLSLLCALENFDANYRKLDNSGAAAVDFLRSNVFNFINNGHFESAASLLLDYDSSCVIVFKSSSDYKDVIEKLLEGNHYLIAGRLLRNLTSNLYSVKYKTTSDKKPENDLLGDQRSIEMKVIKSLHLHGGSAGCSLALNIFDNLLFSNKHWLLHHSFFDELFSTTRYWPQIHLNKAEREDTQRSLESCFKHMKEPLLEGSGDRSASLKYLVCCSSWLGFDRLAMRYLGTYAASCKDAYLSTVKIGAPGVDVSNSSISSSDNDNRNSSSNGSSNSSRDNSERVSGKNSKKIARSKVNVDKVSIDGRGNLHNLTTLMSILSVYLDGSNFYFDTISQKSERKSGILARKLRFNEFILDIISANKTWLGDPTPHAMGHFASLLWSASYECRTNGQTIANVGYFHDHAVCNDNNLDTLGINLAKSMMHLRKSDTEYNNLSKYSNYFHEKYKLDVKLSKDDIFTKVNMPSQTETETETEARSESDFKVDRSLDRIYRNLVSFFCDETVQEIYVRPQNSYERRLYRTMCDEFDFNHYFIFESKYDGRTDFYDNSSDLYSNKYLPTIFFDEFRINRGMVKITKKPKNSDISIPLFGSNIHGMIRPRRLQEILLNDAVKGPLRCYDGELPLWEGFLSKLVSPGAFGGTTSDQHERLKDIASVTLLSCGPRYSIQWGLSWADVLVKNNIPFPHGMLSNLLNHAINRADVYGIMEVLVHAVQEGYRFKRLTSKMKQLGLGTIKIEKLKDSMSYSWDEFKMRTKGGDLSWSSNSTKKGTHQHNRLLGLDTEGALYLRSLNKHLIKTKSSQYLGRNGPVDPMDPFDPFSPEYASSFLDGPNRCDGLKESEWGLATMTIIRLMESKSAFHESVLLEVIRLLKEYGEKLEINGLHAMLHYLTLTRPTSSMTPQILTELHSYSKISNRYINNQIIDDFARIILSRSQVDSAPFTLGAKLDMKSIIQEYKPHNNQGFPNAFDKLLSSLYAIDATADGAHDSVLKVLLFYRMHSSSIEGKLRLFTFLTRFSDRLYYNSQHEALPKFNLAKSNDSIREVTSKMLVYAGFQLLDSAPFTYLPSNTSTSTVSNSTPSSARRQEKVLGKGGLVSQGTPAGDVEFSGKEGDKPRLAFDRRIYSYLMAFTDRKANPDSHHNYDQSSTTTPSSVRDEPSRPLNFHSLIFHSFYKHYQNLDKDK